MHAPWLTVGSAQSALSSLSQTSAQSGPGLSAAQRGDEALAVTTVVLSWPCGFSVHFSVLPEGMGTLKSNGWSPGRKFFGRSVSVSRGNELRVPYGMLTLSPLSFE